MLEVYLACEDQAEDLHHSQLCSSMARTTVLLRFPDDVVVSVVDFAENYAFKEQNEVQSMHWYSSQVTIFVHITYYRKAGER